MMTKEPALTVGTVTAFLTAALGLAVALGANISKEQQDAIIGAVVAAVPIIMMMAATIRQTVYSPNTVQQKVEAAKAGEIVEVLGA